MAENKPNSGVLFKNSRKEKDTHPDYTGSALVNGVDYFMDAWVNESKAGQKYMSFRFNPKDKQSGGGVRTTNAPPAVAPGADPYDAMMSAQLPAAQPAAEDDIPF